jgi:hypothetical protein
MAATVPRHKNRRRLDPPDVDNVKGGALAAASSEPKTSVLSINSISRAPALLFCWDQMATGNDLRAIALSLAGTVEAPHFDRTAFKVKRIYATMPADGLTANLNFTVDEQEFKTMLAPEAFRAIDNGWGRSGWTTAILSELTEAELRDALEMAWRNGASAKPRR